MRPDSVNILGIEYKILYFDKPSEVDRNNRQSLWGQIDYWERIIRVYDNNSNEGDVWQTLMHEILHGISDSLKLKLNDEEMHEELDLLSLALTDVLFRNDWIKRDDPRADQLDRP